MSSNFPFGFTPGDPDDENRGNNPNPAGFDMSQLGAMLSQLGSFLQQPNQADPGTVNWELALDTARKAVVAKGDPSITDGERSATETAVDLAELWLDAATTFPASGGRPAAWSRSEWLLNTKPAWQSIIDPLATRIQDSMTGMLPQAGAGGIPGLPEGLPPEMAAMMAPLMGMAKQMGATMFGMQVAQGLAALAGEVVSASDVGIPLTSDGRPVLLPGNIRNFGEGLGVTERDTMVFLAVRECAHQRLFAHVPWLRSRLAAAVEDYARGIKVDTERIESAVSDIDPTNPQAMQDVLASGVLIPEDTAEQRAALERLETLLALVEGWVDVVVADAIGDRLASFSGLQEAIRRRRAAGGPAERTFATLVGLEMRPRKLREAAELWRSLSQSKGQDGRDATWSHPDLLPTAADLADPSLFIDGVSSDILDEIENFANSSGNTGDPSGSTAVDSDDEDDQAGPQSEDDTNS